MSTTGPDPAPRLTPPMMIAAVDEARFRLLVESVKDYAIFLLDADGRVQTWTEGARLIQGYQADEIVGQHVSRFYMPEDRARREPERLLAEAVARGRVEEEGWRVRRDGTCFWADVVITALHDDQGVLTGFAKVTRDLTERRKTEEERRRREEEMRHTEERFRLMVDAVQDYAIFTLDPRGVIATWNVGAQRLMGYEPAQAIGRHFSMVRTGEDVRGGFCESELVAAARDGRLEGEGWRVRNDGTRFWAHAVLTAVRDTDGALVGFAKITRDLTERARLEEERVARAQAEEALRLKDDFLAIAAHELRTPLTALQIEHRGLQDTVQTNDPRVLKKLARAVRTADRLAALIELLLDVGRIASGKLTLKPERFDLAQAVAQVVDTLRATAEMAGCQVTLCAPAPVEGNWDRLRVEQVVMNVLANAFKYGVGTPVEVSVGRDGDSAVIEIADRGPGIAPKDLSRIFDRFERASPKRHYAGLGLGLYVSREIVGAQKGMISARNLDGGGAAFTVRLPIDSGGG